MTWKPSTWGGGCDRISRDWGKGRNFLSGRFKGGGWRGGGKVDSFDGALVAHRGGSVAVFGGIERDGDSEALL